MTTAFAGQAWGAEGDTHDFPQSFSQLLNDNASINDIKIARQDYPVKEVIITSRTNNANSKVTISVKVGDESFGNPYVETGKHDYSDKSFSGNSTNGAVVITFENGSGNGTGKGTFYVTNVRLVEGASSETQTVSTPTFSPAAGAVISGSTVSISTTTSGARIYYTTNGNEPTTSSYIYSNPIAITEETTIKAFAVKEGYEDSEIAEATYTIKQAISDYTIDFESDLDCYVNWTFSNIGIHTSGVTSAHGGEAWGSNVNENDNAVTTAFIQTKEKVNYPNVFTCYISKESGNTTSSTWKIQVSSDGNSWEDIASLTSMTQNTWTVFTGDIKSKGKTNVYVRLYYNGSNAKRAVDDISLTTYNPNAVSDPVITLEEEYFGSTIATITCSTQGATILYSFDQENWNSYPVGGIEITTSTTLYAKATKGGFEDSNIVSASTIRKLNKPSFSLPGGTYTEEKSVIITTDEDARIYYTLDGSDPTSSSSLYSSPILLNTNCTLKAIAIMGDYSSNVTTAVYTFQLIQDGVFDFESNFSNYGSGLTKSEEYIYEDNTWTAGNVTLVSSGKYRYWTDGTLRFYKTEGDENAIKESAMTISVPQGKVITKIELTGGTAFRAEQGHGEYLSGNWTGSEQSVKLTLNSNSTQTIKTIIVTYETSTEAVSITAAGLATFSSTKPLDFTGADAVEAYTATVSTTGQITYSRIYKVPANTGLVVRSTQGGAVSINVPELTGDADVIAANDLVAVSQTIEQLASTNEDGTTNYILNIVKDKLGFYKANNKKVAAGKAYLKAGVDESRSFIGVDDMTGIESIAAIVSDGQYYDLQGRRVAQPQKGLYIVNGKKVIIK